MSSPCRSKIKTLASLFAIVSCGVWVSSCGGASKQVRTISTAAAQAELARGAGNDADSDGDGDGGGIHDRDDGLVLRFGSAAGAAEKSAITDAVVAYYVTAAAEDGLRACKLTVRLLAKSLPEDEGPRGYGPSFTQGLTTCPAIMASTFKYYHNQLSAPVEVTGVRVKGDQADVLLASRTLPPGSFTEVMREGGTWRIDRFLTGRLP